MLREEFSSQFKDFRSLKSRIVVFALPCTCEIRFAPVELQLELNALQEDDVLVQNFSETNLIDFHKSLPVAEYY